MKRRGWISLLLLLPGIAHPQRTSTFCDLLRNPQEFNGKQVTVRATWRYGFEWSELYCLDCRDQGKVWLDLSADLDEPSEKRLKRIPKGAGTVNLTIRGTFHGPGSYGHLNGYRYEIVPESVSNVVVLSKGIKSRDKEEQIEKCWACGGIRPK